MARLCVAPGCRMQALLAEVGEASGPCGNCDHCRGLLAPARRLPALVLGLGLRARGNLQALLQRDGHESSAPEAEIEPAKTLPAQEAALPTVEEERLLGLLVNERKRLARLRRLPARKIASDEALQALARNASQASAEAIDEDAAQALLRVVAETRRPR